MVRCQTNKVVFSLIREIEEKGFGHFFIISSSSHFFNKADFEEYLNKTFCWN